MELRDYQEAALNNVAAAYRADKRRVVLTMPTGAGKTVTAAAMATVAISRGYRVLMLVHRQELVHQAEAAMRSAGLEVGVVWKKRKEVNAAVVITTIQSRMKLDTYGPEDLIIVDECHHAVSRTWKDRLDQHQARVLGLTATPLRRDGRGLREVFDALVIGRRVDELIAAGSLSGYRLLAPPGGYNMDGAKKRMGDFAPEAAQQEAMIRVADVVDAVTKHARGRKMLVFCVSILHAEETREKLHAQGIRCDLLTGKTSDKQRAAVEQQFRDGELDALINVDLFGEGYDCPECDCVVLARPTMSLSLYLQQVGRAMRPADGKKDALIIDCARNSQRLGLPDAIREWSLDSTRKKTKERDASLWTCPECFSSHPPGKLKCQYCEHEREINSRMIEETPEVLVEIANTRGEDIAGDIAQLHGKTVAYAAAKHPNDLDAALTLVEDLGREYYHRREK